ncbi:MAG: sugar phosphate isomerase/epimerase [Thermaceae bacterium]|nr:sugar phosphate isomerase/epimerase [Thermaceae bacterium]
MKLACQENLLPGTTLEQKWDFAQKAGFEAIEIQAGSAEEFRARIPKLLEAKRWGVVMSSICLAGGPFIGEFEESKRRQALERMKLLLAMAPEIGAHGVVTPAAWGIFSLRLPPHTPPRSTEDDRAVLLAGLSQLGTYAAGMGSTVFLEPLNRYEDHMINTLEQACGYCEEVGLDSLKVIADLYHMNIEEANISLSLRIAKKHVAHIHLADSNRLEPGAGHINFKTAFRALNCIGFAGYMAVECRLSTDASAVLPALVDYLRPMMPVQEERNQRKPVL